jgi:O-antigen/teichoic acid export membrane protein
MFNIKSKLKELSFYFSTQALLIVTPIIYIPLISSFLSPEEFGKTSLFLMVLSFSSQLFYGPISNGVNRFYYQAVEIGKLSLFYHSIERIIVRISGLVFIIIILLYEFSKILEDFSLLELILVFFVIFFFGIYVIYNGLLGVQRQRPKQMILEIFVNMSKLLSIYLIFKFIIKLNISVIFSSLVSLIVAFVLLFFLLNYKFVGFKKK